ncbi:hypothetical protein EPD60_10600 [Flaviaesturariibacter flavus]|uniref:Uncharacterized protein n=1 Tax=Flaviaesturariibacter flavus TaxID=2502780 RepID=A0A4R1BBN6_9BACT|nr:hypothetical protein [Flaviaesturariibacter flavus]TCJ14431.1 hypothetical protein EPD60_10600 [Flaviaesturariibacter flavus]
MMEIVKIQFQTPQDFQRFRKLALERVVSVNIAELSMICHCFMSDIANAINLFGATITDAPIRPSG